VAVRFRSRSWAFVVLALVASACTSGGSPDPTTPPPSQQASAEMASTDLYVGAPQRVGVGVFFANNDLLSFGTAHFAFAFTGTAAAPTKPKPGPEATATYVPTPGTPAGIGQSPAVTPPSQARGIYQAENVIFDRAGFWTVTVTADVKGRGTLSTVTTFPVAEQPALPAPGQPALPTKNLTIYSKGVPKAAIDSQYANDGVIPDPELHHTTIAQALKRHEPALVVFSTPVYCVSRFCGPVTDVVDALSKRYDDRAVFIHIEIWRDFQQQVINQAAADWLYRNGDLTEPWVYLIGADGTILDRWTSLFPRDEVAAELEQLPPLT
jgi:hypothetical protein